MKLESRSQVYQTEVFTQKKGFKFNAMVLGQDLQCKGIGRFIQQLRKHLTFT